jgi:hypothetical protein
MYSLLLKHTPRLPSPQEWAAMSDEERLQWSYNFHNAPRKALEELHRIYGISIAVVFGLTILTLVLK